MYPSLSIPEGFLSRVPDSELANARSRNHPGGDFEMPEMIDNNHYSFCRPLST